MHSNEKLIHQFYAAFEQKDYLTMQSLYHDDATFNDPVFEKLNAAEVRAMWEMLVKAGKDLRISYSNISANDAHGKCRWEAWYTFSKTGKKVHNVIDATFEFRDEKIIVHHDSFDFWKWTRQALGVPGILFGWSGLIQGKVRTSAQNGLQKFMVKA